MKKILFILAIVIASYNCFAGASEGFRITRIYTNPNETIILCDNNNWYGIPNDRANTKQTIALLMQAISTSSQIGIETNFTTTNDRGTIYNDINRAWLIVQ